MPSDGDPARAVPRPSDAEGPDARYAFVAGLYAAALLVPIVVLALSRLDGGAVALYVGSLAAVAGVTAVAGRAASRTPGLAIGLSPLFASIGAFLVTDLGNLAWLSRRRP